MVSTAASTRSRGGRVVGLGVDGEALHVAQRLAGERVEQGDLLDLVVEQLDAQRFAVRLGREHVDHFAAHAEGAALKSTRCACTAAGSVLDQVALVDALALGQDQAQRQVVLGRAHAVDADTVATTIASGRDSRVLVADRRICSMCSLIELSFSMKVSATARRLPAGSSRSS
jgi:hypothetical protein